MKPAPAADVDKSHQKRRVALLVGVVLALFAAGWVFALVSGNDQPSNSSSLVVPTTISGVKPLLIEHGFDLAGTESTAKNATAIDGLPFDGITILPKENPCSVAPVNSVIVQADMAAMPKLAKVKHNFLLCRLIDNATTGGPSPYDVSNDANWSTISSNLATYATAAKATGAFDGLMIDTEYYGIGPNPWDYDTIAIPVNYDNVKARPWTLPNDARARSQARGKQVADAIKAAWPDAVIFSLRGAAVSDKNSYKSANMGGNDVAWANELAGPFFVGMVESVVGSSATIVDGGESYYQRTQDDFGRAYAWSKVGLADSAGPMVPSGAVTAASYKATVSVASQVFDRDVKAKLAPFDAAQLQRLLTFARQSTDRYYWFYNEQFDWRGSGEPTTPVPAAIVAALAASR